MFSGVESNILYKSSLYKILISTPLNIWPHFGQREKIYLKKSFPHYMIGIYKHLANI